MFNKKTIMRVALNNKRRKQLMKFHTFELSLLLTLFEKKHITDILYKSKGKTYIDNNEYIPTLVCNTLTKHGITIKIKSFIKNEYKYHILNYRINPRCVMEEYNYIGIFDPDDTEIMVNKVNNYLISIDEFMPLVEQCKLSRIDFCANIEMSGQHEIFEYIKILQKGYCPKKFIPELFYDYTAKRSKFFKNSCSFIRKNTVKVTYYNKYSQLQQNDRCKNIDDAVNILRAEIQCDKNKVKHLSDKFGCTSVVSFLRNADMIGTYVFKKYSNIFFGEGDFYKTDEIYELIEKSRYKEKTKKMMKMLVQLSSKHGSLQKAFNKLEWDRVTRNNVIKKFNKLGVSPIAIPLRCKYDCFKNPLTLALNS